MYEVNQNRRTEWDAFGRNSGVVPCNTVLDTIKTVSFPYLTPTSRFNMIISAFRISSENNGQMVASSFL